ncbi:hypothetical protein [Rhodococcus sovatensis]|uniref:DUF2613 domain-containing protein n=1 Tax=Rhodococcus sovatensis TaxID=1805840 RepID=A0ABZ2PL19_9NOCA
MKRRGVQNVTTTIKLAGFVLGITAVFFLAYVIGTAVGPVGVETPVNHEHAQVEHVEVEHR